MTPDPGSTERGDGFGGDVASADARPGGDDDHVRRVACLSQRGLQSLGAVAHDPPRDRQAARREDERSEPRCGRVAHLSRVGGRLGGDDLVAGREDGYARAGVDIDLDDSERREEGEIRRSQPPAAHCHDVVAAHILIGRHDTFAGGDGPYHLDRALHGDRRVLHHHDCVGAVREGTPGGNRDRAARLDSQTRETPHRHRPVELEVGRHALRGAEGVGGTDGVAIDGRSREPGQGRRGS